MIDHFHRDSLSGRPLEGAGGGAIQAGPGVFVDLGLQCGFQALIRVIGAQEICVADEEAFLVIIGIDEPGGDAIRVVRTDVAGIGIEHVDAIYLNPDGFAAIIQDGDVGFAEHHEHIAAASIFQLGGHVHVRIDPGL